MSTISHQSSEMPDCTTRSFNPWHYSVLIYYSTCKLSPETPYKGKTVADLEVEKERIQNEMRAKFLCRLLGVCVCKGGGGGGGGSDLSVH